MKAKYIGQIVRVLFVSWLLILLQTVLMYAGKNIVEYAPNFCVALIVYLAFAMPSRFGVLLAFLVGLSLDLLSGARLGPWAGGFAVIFGILACSVQRLIVDSGLLVVLAVTVGSVLSSLLAMTLSYGLGSLGSTTLVGLIIGSIISGLLAPLFFAAFRRAIPMNKSRI